MHQVSVILPIIYVSIFPEEHLVYILQLYPLNPKPREREREMGRIDEE
jgi:hypothetical protein